MPELTYHNTRGVKEPMLCLWPVRYLKSRDDIQPPVATFQISESDAVLSLKELIKKYPCPPQNMLDKQV
jgi:hypothetical protein